MTNQDLLTERYSTRVLANAARALEDWPSRISHDLDDPSVYWVAGSKADIYRVQVVGNPPSEVEPDLPWVSCSCPNGMNKGGQPRCFHSAAALMAWLDIDTAAKGSGQVER